MFENRSFTADNAGIGGVLLLLLISQVALTPSLVPFVFFTMHSVWVPQIWRNARRGSARALYPSFVIGLSIARLALPLCTSRSLLL